MENAGQEDKMAEREKRQNDVDESTYTEFVEGVL